MIRLRAQAGGLDLDVIEAMAASSGCGPVHPVLRPIHQGWPSYRWGPSSRTSTRSTGTSFRPGVEEGAKLSLLVQKRMTLPYRPISISIWSWTTRHPQGAGDQSVVCQTASLSPDPPRCSPQHKGIASGRRRRHRRPQCRTKAIPLDQIR